MMKYETTHETETRRVRWVHDETYETRGSYAFETEEVTRKAEDEEIEGLNNGNLVVLGAIVETRCSSCKQWEDRDSLWGIVVSVDENLTALGNAILEIPAEEVA